MEHWPNIYITNPNIYVSGVERIINCCCRIKERKGYDDRFSKTTLRGFEGTARGRLVQDIIKGVSLDDQCQ